MLLASRKPFQCHWLGMVVHLDKHCSKAFELISTKVGQMLYLTFVWRTCAGYQRCTEYVIIGKGEGGLWPLVMAQVCMGRKICVCAHGVWVAD